MPRSTKQPVEAAPYTAKPPVPDKLRPFLFHGIELTWRNGDKNAVGDCPFCGNDGKFSVNIGTGAAHCWTCTVDEDAKKGGVNVTTFLRRLWELSFERTNGEGEAFARERGLLYSDTLMHWGVVKSAVTGHWLVPGYNADGALMQLYKRIRTAEGCWEMRPTPTVSHYLHGVPLYVRERREVWLHESWGNALAFWEAGRTTKVLDGRFVQTGSEASSLLADANVLAVANCGAVGEGLLRFSSLFAGKRLVLCFDSDHPRVNNGVATDGAGFAAAKRAAKVLSGAKEPPVEIAWLAWGDAGFDPSQRSGWDVRDLLCND